MNKEIVIAFMTVTKPFIERVESTKDMKPIRKALWFRDLIGIRDPSAIADLDTKSFGAILCNIRDSIIKSDIGGKTTRADIWRRLLWVEILMGLHPELLTTPD